MTPVRWTEQAAEDVRRIREFIERDSPKYGRLVAERIVDATERLELFPRSGRVVPELHREDVREIILGEYRNCVSSEGRSCAPCDRVQIVATVPSSRIGEVNLGGALHNKEMRPRCKRERA